MISFLGNCKNCPAQTEITNRTRQVFDLLEEREQFDPESLEYEAYSERLRDPLEEIGYDHAGAVEAHLIAADKYEREGDHENRDRHIAAAKRHERLQQLAWHESDLAAFDSAITYTQEHLGHPEQHSSNQFGHGINPDSIAGFSAPDGVKIPFRRVPPTVALTSLTAKKKPRILVASFIKEAPEICSNCDDINCEGC